MILLFASFCIRKKSHLIAKKKTLFFDFDTKILKTRFEIVRDSWKRLEHCYAVLFLEESFWGAFYVIPGCGFLEVLEIKNLVETPLAMTIRKTR